MTLKKFVMFVVILLIVSMMNPSHNTVISQIIYSEQHEIFFSRVLGGVGYDYATGIDSDSNDNLYLTGTTGSVDFPKQSVNATFLTGPQSAFITKLNFDGSLNWSMFFGGTTEEKGVAIEVDLNDDIILLGETTSSDLPTKNAYESNHSGGDDGFLAKFQNDGQLIWSTYFGSVGQDNPASLVINSKNEIIIAGSTVSDQFPLLNPFDSTHGGSGWEIFISKFSPNGDLIWSTYHGGTGSDFLPSLAIDGDDNIIIGGVTGSSDFNSTNGQFPNYAGNEDNFVSKFSDNGTLIWSTFLGGTGENRSGHVTVNSLNEIIISGVTSSTDFPVLNSYDSSINGARDAYLSKFSSDGVLLWSTYFGGILDDETYGITHDSNDFLLITGYTGFTNFPLLNGFDSLFQGTSEGFTARFNSDGQLNRSSYFGGNGLDRGWDITLTSNGNIVVVGDTSSTDFPRTEGGGALGYDAFVMILKENDIQSNTVTTPSQSVITETNTLTTTETIANTTITQLTTTTERTTIISTESAGLPFFTFWSVLLTLMIIKRKVAM